MSTVQDGKVVAIHFTMTDEQGEVLDTTEEDGPMPYLHGAENIVAGLEAALAGKKVGDKFTVTVPPEEGYGLHDGLPPQEVPRSEFPEDAELEPGMEFVAEAEDGSETPVWIFDVEGDTVLVDHNHPLADETLVFSVEVVSVRDATREEIEHGHPHGLDGDDFEVDED